MKSEGGYLFVTFSGESPDGEQIYFSLSRDGLHWKDLNKGRSVLQSDVGTRGVRDPFILRGAKADGFYLIATDLRIASGVSWPDAVRHGSKSVILWKSKDLIHWSKPKLCTVGPDDAGCVWAPEAVFDTMRNCYMMFWSSFVNQRHRIFCTWTGDFQTFTHPELYLETDGDVIDMTILNANGLYFRFYKDENRKNIHMDCGKDLLGKFSPVVSPSLERITGVEGPAAFQMRDGKYCLLLDRFASGGGYMPLVSGDLKQGSFEIPDKNRYQMGDSCKRHGSVLEITEQEFQVLQESFEGETDEAG